MRRVLLATAAVLAAVLLQVTVLNNVPFPGGSGPNLVLVVVVAMALAAGPRDGAIIGFAAGLALDIAPPASGLLGQSALVFCLVGYGCGRLRLTLERSAWLPLAGVALGAAAGEVLYALIGLIFGDPDVTWQAVRQVLPAAVFYDLLISPFVLYAVAQARRVRPVGDRQRPGGPAHRAGAGPAGAGRCWAGPVARSRHRDGPVPAAAGRRRAPHRRLDRRRPGSARPAGRRVGGPAPPAAAAAARRHGRVRGGAARRAMASRPAAGHGPPAAGHPAPPRRDDRGRRYLAGAAPGAAFDGRAGPGRSARLRGGALTGGPSALGQRAAAASSGSPG